MIYRVWRIRNRITGRYLALCRADGSLDYIAFLTKQIFHTATPSVQRCESALRP